MPQETSSNGSLRVWGSISPTVRKIRATKKKKNPSAPVARQAGEVDTHVGKDRMAGVASLVKSPLFKRLMGEKEKMQKEVMQTKVVKDSL